MARVAAGALRLRDAGIDLPILVLGPPVSTELATAIQRGMTLATGSWSMVRAHPGDGS